MTPLNTAHELEFGCLVLDLIFNAQLATEIYEV